MGLKDKASKLDFSRLPGIADGAAASRPKTAPGAMMAFANDARSELLKENEQLRAKASQADELQGRLDEALHDLALWDGAKATRQIDPAHIHPSRWANRHELSFAGPEFDALKAEIAEAGGNVQPIKVRPIGEVEGLPRYEIVFGHRRHQACLQLGLPVLCMVDNLTDAALFVEMERENRNRQDLSAWEQGVMYRRALDAGLFPSMRRLADAIGAQVGNVSTAIQIASLPDEVVRAFSSPLDLQFRWIGPLKEALERDPQTVLARAREIGAGQPKPTAKEVLARLTGGEASPAQGLTRAFTVGGKAVGGWEKDARGNVTLRLKKGALAPADEKQLLEFVARFFD